MKLWLYLENGGKRAVEVAHRRWGKDDVALHYTACAAMQRVGNYWHMLPEYGQARKAIWEAVNPRTGKRRIDEAFPEEIRETTRQQEMMIKFRNGSTWQLVGSDNFNSLVGSPPIGIVNSEYALANPEAWAYMAPILEENGGWGIFIYTPRGKNHGLTMYEFAVSNPSWFAEKLSADKTPVFTPEQLIQIKHDLQGVYGDQIGELMFNQEYMCAFDSVLLACFFLGVLEGHNMAIPGVPGKVVAGKHGVEFVHDKNSNLLEVWRYPYFFHEAWDEHRWTHRYCIGSDISEGLGGDVSVAYVFDRHLRQIVARMHSNRIDSHRWGDRLSDLSRYYENALIIPERNGAGITTINRLLELKANLYVNETIANVGSSITRTYGWNETKDSKQYACGLLKAYLAEEYTDSLGVKRRKNNVFCKTLLRECATFIKDEERERLGADEGCHDDHVIAAAMCLAGDLYLPKTEKIPHPETGWKARLQKEREKAGVWGRA